MKILIMILLGVLMSSLLLQGQQNVGIGTTSPNSKSILDLSSTSRVLLLPRMTNTQMNAIASPPVGSLIFNTEQSEFMGYVFSHNTRTLLGGIQTINRWRPISSGPKMRAWGIVDSFGDPIRTSGNVTVNWDGYNATPASTNNWYTITINGHKFYKDSMMLMVTAIGNGSWDQAIAVSEIVEGSFQRATIKFTDVSRIAAGWSTEGSRRRSSFYFVLYDLRDTQ